jgi:Arc/MetJ-type ribon-helix-helix transcriptional regulator
MRTLTVRLPEALAAQIEAESRSRGRSKSDVVRERLSSASRALQETPPTLDAIADVIGSVDRLPRDLSARTKKYLKATGYGEKRAR